MSPEGKLSEKDRKRNLGLDVLSSKLRQNYEFFASLSKKELLEFLRSCDSQKFQAGEIIFEEGELDAVWFIIISGRVLIHRDDKAMGYIGEGQCFGEVGLLKNAPHSASARADTDTIVLSVQRTILSDNMPAIGYKVLEYIASQLADKLAKANLQIENMGIEK